MIAVNLGEPGDRVKAYVSQMQLTFPVVIDQGGQVAERYEVRYTPTHHLIDRSGTVRAGGAGGRDWNGPTAHAAVDALLAKKSATPSTARPVRVRANSPPGSGGQKERK